MLDLNIKQREEPSLEMLNKWYVLQQQLREIREQEAELRAKLFTNYFHDPKEGVNNHTLPDGYILKGKRVVTRSIDKGALNASIEGLRAVNIIVDELVDWKPTLKLSAYNKLTPEQQKVFDQILVVKDGAPGLEIVAPKRGK